MREILFRGKSLDKGEWVEGNYSVMLSGRVAIQPIGRIITYEVLPTTVGQFTGLLDKNGKKIFEGDIIKFINGRLLDVRFNRETLQWELTDVGVPDWEVNHLHNTLPLSELEVETCYGEMTSEIVGNIHDNPELLKGEKRLTYEESRAEYFTKLIEAHKKALEMVEKFCPDEKVKQERYSEQSEIIQYINDSQQALKKNEELKRLLKLAIEDFDTLYDYELVKCSSDFECKYCPFCTRDINSGLYCCNEWRYKEEAEKLLEGDNK